MYEELQKFDEMMKINWTDLVMVRKRRDQIRYSEQNKIPISATKDVKRLAEALRNSVDEDIKRHERNRKQPEKRYQLIRSYIALQKSSILRTINYNKKRGNPIFSKLHP